MNEGRYEIKFFITYADYIEIYNKLKHIMSLDSHTVIHDDYFVRSLYYDDLYDTSYISKINDNNNRKKYRVRAYNMNDNTILFERKEKHNNKIEKTSFSLTRQQYNQLSIGKFDFFKEIDSPIATEIYGLYNSMGLHPVVIVDYNRTALVHPISNTRITFDKNLRAGINSYDIFDSTMFTYPIFPNNSVIMEVKYDTEIPAHISAMLGSMRSEKISVSKFCLCREKVAHLNLKKAFIY